MNGIINLKKEKKEINEIKLGKIVLKCVEIKDKM